MNDFLLQYEKLYHFSPEANRMSILEKGILPSREKYKDSDFHSATNGDNRPMVCLTRHDQIASFIETQRGYESVDPIVCEIDTKAVAALRIGLDWTVNETMLLFTESDLSPFVEVSDAEHELVAQRSLDELRTLVCFDIIPPEAFIVRESLDFVEPRQQSFDEWELSTRPPRREDTEGELPNKAENDNQ